jgi:6-phosphofructokinase 1
MGEEDPRELELLKTTPSSALGSVRYKLADPDVDDTDYKRMLEVFKKYDVRYFFYNGGNDSMDTCNKISKFMQKSGYEMRVMGVPKTIDNDLWATDHCPGFASAAKYIATPMMEVYQDARVYDTGTITIIEIMGRNAGWLTAASALAGIKGAGPDLIYLPEREFVMDAFLDQVQDIYNKTGKVIVAVSEGIKDKDGKYISEYGMNLTQQKDSFGHAQLGGLAYTLSNFVREKTGAKIRAIEFSLMQRCAAHIASKTDYEESFLAGQTAVKEAVAGKTDYMVGFKCDRAGGYKCSVVLVPLDEVANKEKKIPDAWITSDGVGVTQDFIDYALPLIQGETELPKEDGLPRFARLKKVLAAK